MWDPPQPDTEPGSPALAGRFLTTGPPGKSLHSLIFKHLLRTLFPVYSHCLNDLLYYHGYDWASLVAQSIKNLPAMWETWVQSLDWEDPLEEDMATHSSVLAWRIPMDRGVWRATVHGVAKSQTQLND